MFIAPPKPNFPENCAAARQHLQQYQQFTPAQFAALRRKRFITLLEHHYLASENTTYHDFAQKQGFSPQTRRRSWLPWSGKSPARSRLAIADHTPLEDLLAMLPITDKALLVAGNYDQHPAVPRQLVHYKPATSGTTTGKRAYIAMTPTGMWTSYVEVMLWYLLMYGIDPVNSQGYMIAHFLHQQPEEERNFATYVAFSALQKMAPEQFGMGSTQDSLEQHIAQLARPVQWVIAAPTFYRVVALRASDADLARMQLDTIFWGAAPISRQDDDLVREKFKLRHSLGIYISTEGGYSGIQLAEHTPYVNPADRLIIEIVDDQGRQVAPGETGEVLVTNLAHEATPIIRYRIGDRARYLGHPARNADLWRDLELPALSDQNVPASGIGLFRHGIFFDSLSRSGGLLFGAMKISYEDVAHLQNAMAQRGTPTLVLQIAKQLNASGNPIVVARLEAPPDRTDEYRANMREVLHQAAELEYYFTTGELPEPTIEISPPGELSAGRFKVPPLQDETIAKQQ